MNLEDLYTAVINNPELMRNFQKGGVLIDQGGTVIIDGIDDITKEILDKVKAILLSQKYFFYADGDDLILALFCWLLDCLLDFEKSRLNVKELDLDKVIESRIMLIYRLLCENLTDIEFYSLSDHVGAEVKNEHVATESFIDQLSRIKNEASRLKSINRCRNEDGDKVELLDVTVESKESNSQNIEIMDFIESKLPSNFDNKVEVCFKFGDDIKEKDRKNEKDVNFNVFVWYDKKSSEMRFISDNFAATKSEFDFVEKKLIEKKYFDYQKGNEFILNLFTCYLKKSLEAEQGGIFIDLTQISNDQIQEIYNKFITDVSKIELVDQSGGLPKPKEETMKKILSELDQIAVNCKRFDEKSYNKFIYVPGDPKGDLIKERMTKIKSGKIPLNRVTYVGNHDYYEDHFTCIISGNVPDILDDQLIASNELFEVVKKNKAPAFHTKIKNLLGPYELFSAQQCIELINEDLIKLNFSGVETRSAISFDKKQDELAPDLFKLIKIIFFESPLCYIRDHLCSCEPKYKRQLAQAIIDHLPNMVDDSEKDKDKKIEIIKQITKEQKYRDEFFKLVGTDAVVDIDNFLKGLKKNNEKVSLDDFVQFVKDNNLVITQDNFEIFISWLKNNICVDSSDNLKKLVDCIVSLLKDKEFGSAERINLIEFMNYLCEDQNLNKDGDKLADCYYKLVEDIIKSNKFKNDNGGKCTIYPSNAVKILDYMFIMQSKFKNNPIKIVEIVNALTAQPVWDCFQLGSFIRETLKVFKKYDFRSIYQENTKNKLSDKEICDILNKSTSSPIYTDSKKYEFEIKFDMDSDGHLFLPLLLQHENQAQRQEFCLKLGNQKYVDGFLKSLNGDTSCFDNVLSMKSFDALVLQFKEFVINHPDVKELPDPEGHADNREMLLRSELLKPRFSIELLGKMFENIFSRESNAVSLDKLDRFTDWLVYVIDNYSDLVYKADEYRDNNVQLYDDLIKKCFRDDFKLGIDRSVGFVKKLADILNSKFGKKIIDGLFVTNFIADRCLAEGKKFTPQEVVELTWQVIDGLNTRYSGLISISTIESIIINYTDFDGENSHNTKIGEIFLVMAKQYYECNKKIDGNVYDLLLFVLRNKFGKPGTSTQLFEYYEGRHTLIKEEIAEIVGVFNQSKIFRVNKEKYYDDSKYTGIKFDVNDTGRINKVTFNYQDKRNNKYTAEVNINNEVKKENSNQNESNLITKVSNLDDKSENKNSNDIQLENNLNPTGEKNNDNNEKSRALSSNQKGNIESSSKQKENINNNIDGKDHLNMEGGANKESNMDTTNLNVNKNKQEENPKLQINDERNINLKINNDKTNNSIPKKIPTPYGNLNNQFNEQPENSIKNKTGEKHQDTNPKNSDQSGDVKNDPQVIQKNNSFFTWNTKFCIGVMSLLCVLAVFIKLWILAFVVLPAGYMIYKGFKCKQFNDQKKLTESNLQFGSSDEQQNKGYSVDQNLSKPLQIDNLNGKEKDNNNENNPLIEQ